MQWIYKPIPKIKALKEYATSLNISLPLSQFLIQRNIDLEKAPSFLTPSLKELHDPFLMKDMDKAVNRLIEAIEKNQKILVYGDYDVDGTSSVSLFYGFLSQSYSQMEYYIPDRYKEGYGVSQQGIDYAIEHEFSLIVSIDCGIKAHDKIAYAKENDIDFIVCDHHEPSEILPNAIAILDPKRTDCFYPFKELCGCGVAFKFLHAYCLQTHQPFTKLFQHLDLVAVATIADIVPIIDENRILTYHGLQKVNENPSFGLKALMNLTSYEGDFNAMNVAFGIAPRINAAGRIKHASYAVQVLLSKTEEEAEAYAKEIDEFNQTRKELDGSITEEALTFIESNEELKQTKTTVLYQENWHKGVIGIVASRCIEKYYRPTVILTKSGDKVVGSVRSVLGFDIYQTLLACEDVLEQFGGHQYAAGLTLKEENIEKFKERFEKVVSETILTEQISPQLILDNEVSFNDISMDFYEDLVKISPFGPKNQEPVFYSQKVYVKKVRILKDKHLQLELYQDGQKTMIALGFNMLRFAPYFQHGIPFNIAYSIQINEYQGKKKLQLMIKDFQF